MEAIGLRIGNLVLFTDNETVFEVLSIDNQGSDLKNESEEIWIDHFQLSGIPLTEEWLLKLGFKKEKAPTFGGQDQWAGMKAWSFAGVWLFRGEPQCLHLVGYFNTQIQYVHQLQNLYYALTGQELTIKE